MREERRNMRNILKKISGWKKSAALLPAGILMIFMGTILVGYREPQAGQYDAAKSEIGWLEEVLASENTEEATSEAKNEAVAAETLADLEDGEYEGSANGYGGVIKVKVTIENHSIKAIDILSASGETKSFFNRAKSVVDAMIEKQSTDVDGVSGATYSSEGIIAAVKNALFGTESTNETASVQGESVPKISTVKESGTWEDGVYTGSGKGFGGNISVEVTVKNGKIKKIKITNAPGEGASYLNKAKGVISSIINKQSTNVDAVSGATCSSDAVKQGCEKAFEAAKK